MHAARLRHVVGAHGADARALAAAWEEETERELNVFRAGLEIFNCLTLPQQVFARPGLAERIREIGAAHDGARVPGPDRAAVLDLVA